jgi:hypothetical protein
MFAVAGMQAVTQIMSGRAQDKQAKLNASIYEQQAGFSDVLAKMEGERSDIARDIDLTQMRRAKSKMNSTLIANVAGAGLDLSGSPMAVMLDNLTQAGIDEEITKYNYATSKATNQYSREQEKVSMLSTASQLRYKGKIAKSNAYSSAFTTMMQGGYNYGTRTGTINTSGGATKAGKG